MPTVAIVGFNIVCAVLGAFIAIFGLVSFLFKEKFYLSETCKNDMSFRSWIPLTLHSTGHGSRSNPFARSCKRNSTIRLRPRQ